MDRNRDTVIILSLFKSSSPASLNTSHSNTVDVSMETVEDEETKRAKRILEMVSLWVCHSIR